MTASVVGGFVLAASATDSATAATSSTDVDVTCPLSTDDVVVAVDESIAFTSLLSLCDDEETRDAVVVVTATFSSLCASRFTVSPYAIGSMDTFAMRRQRGLREVVAGGSEMKGDEVESI